MSLMKEAFRAKVLANADVVTAFGDRVYTQALPQKPTYPAATLTIISAPRDHTMDGQSGYVESRIQVDCWHPRELEAGNAAEKIRLAMGGLPATVLGVDLNCISVEDERDLFDDDLRVYGASVDYLVIYNEAKPV